MVGLAESLCEQNQITIKPEWRASDDAVAMIADLYNRGSLSFDWG